MDDLREVIAEAIHGREEYWEATNAEEQGMYREQADAALAAIKQAGFVVVPAEPTPGMLEAACAPKIELSVNGYCNSGNLYPDSAAVAYRAMIEAANAPT